MRRHRHSPPEPDLARFGPGWWHRVQCAVCHYDNSFRSKRAAEVYKSKHLKECYGTVISTTGNTDP